MLKVSCTEMFCTAEFCSLPGMHTDLRQRHGEHGEIQYLQSWDAVHHVAESLESLIMGRCMGLYMWEVLCLCVKMREDEAELKHGVLMNCGNNNGRIIFVTVMPCLALLTVKSD